MHSNVSNNGESKIVDFTYGIRQYIDTEGHKSSLHSEVYMHAHIFFIFI